MPKAYSHINQIRVLVFSSVITGITLLKISQAISLESAGMYVGSVTTVTFPSLEITLPRDDRYYSVPVLVEGNYRGNDFKDNLGYFLLSGSFYESDNYLGGTTVKVPVTESTKEDDKWKSLIYFEVACNSDGRVHVRESRRRHKKLDLRMQFSSPTDDKAYIRKTIWKGANVVCATTAKMPEEESKYLVPYNSTTTPEIN
jgi:hypothetical protein